MIALLAIHSLLFTITVLAAYGTGTIVLRGVEFKSAAERAGFQIAAGLGTLTSALFLLALSGAVNRLTVAVLYLPLSIVGAIRAPRPSTLRRVDLTVAAIVLMLIVLFVLCLYPATAFDETTYHMPTVRAFAESGRMPFLGDLRAPVFPNADELLRVPLFLWSGATATHLLTLAVAVAIALMVGGRSPVAAAIFLSSPLIVFLSTSAYVECLLALFATAAFLALEQWLATRRTSWLWWSALFAGAAASTKYLGLFCAAVVFVTAVATARSGRLRVAAVVTAGSLAVALPWYLRILALTGNPVFPFAPVLFGDSTWAFPPLQNPLHWSELLTAWIRLPFDTLFARERVGLQPPLSPWFALALPFAVMRMRRDRRVAFVLIVALVWSVIWLFIRPRDARYLTMLVPLASLVIADLLSRGRRAVAVLGVVAVLPGLMYGAYRIHKLGPVPTDTRSSDRFLASQVPAYRGMNFLNATAHGPVAYTCGGENLVWYFDGRLIGDYSGVGRYDRVLSGNNAAIAGKLDRLGVTHVVVVPSRCGSNAFDANPYYVTLFADQASIVYGRTAR